MSRMFKPSPGEVVDRITILYLKILHCQEDAKLAVFKEEHDACYAYLASAYPIFSSGQDTSHRDLFNEMQHINTQLWNLEDRQRIILKEHWDIDHIENEMYFDEFGGNAIKVVQLNDQRAKLVQEINKACGVYQPEKLHYEVKS